MDVNLFSFALKLSLVVVAANQCVEPGLKKRDECIKLIFGFNRCLNNSLYPIRPDLYINGSNQTFENQMVPITVTLDGYNSSDTPYTEFLCLTKPNPELFDLIPQFYPLHCEKDVTDEETTMQVNWKTAGNDIYVYVFVKRNDSDQYEGCDRKRVDITYDKKMNVEVQAHQDNSTSHRLFQMGDVSITINANPPVTNESLIKGEEPHEGSGMPSLETNEYHYTIFFDNNETQFNRTSESTFEVTHSFTREGNNTVFVEVLYIKKFNESVKRFFYGQNNIKFEVYEPIKDTNMKFTNKSGSNVSVEVTASGSVPISVSWIVTTTNKSGNLSSLCNKKEVVLSHRVEIGSFNCSIKNPGTYYFHANFSNQVSNKTDEFKYSIKKPSNNKTVVTTSTTVVIVALLIVGVVLAIVFVSGYISYRKLKNRSTETADFTFVDLDNPSRLQRVKNQLANVKNRVSRSGSRNKLGLVQPKDGEMSDVESFYGSLTHFPDHNNL